VNEHSSGGRSLLRQ